MSTSKINLNKPHKLGNEAFSNDKKNEQNVNNSEKNQEMSPILESTSLDNGLDPIAIELISSGLEMPPEIIEIRKINDNDKENTDEIISDMKSFETDVSTSTTVEDITVALPKMSREMKNLQKSTQNSKVLSNYLNDFDSPRIRNRKIKETNSFTSESDITADNLSLINDKEVALKSGTTDNDSDSTIVVRDEIGKKRRRSISRSRRTAQRSKSVANRPKSLSRMLSDEMAATSDKEDNRDEDEIEDLTSISLTTTKPIENRAPNPPPKPGWDSFCFKCHGDNAVLSLACKNCKCSFHRHCARVLYTPIPKNPDDFICADCIEINKIQQGTVNKYNHPKIDLHTLKDMLLTILEKIRTYPDRECYENDIQFRSTKESNQPLIVTQISLKTIEGRIMTNCYKVSEAFLHDIKQLEHNWTIIDKNKVKSLKNILKFVVTEINEMEACVHCYSSSFVISNWFTIPCKRPHLLIWAKLKGYPYWPAKVMSIDNQKLYADVRFFGAHDRAWVPTAHCLIFSEKDPNKIARSSTPTTNKGTSKTQKGIFDAMKEKDEYIQNIREKYGFRYATSRELLDPNIFQKQLENQLPNLKKEVNGTDKTENEGNQKEKLTLKIVKTSDGTQTIEQKIPKTTQEKDRHIYRVLSKNENDSENNDQSRIKAIILKRNTQTDSEGVKLKGVDDSETSETNLSFQEAKTSLTRRKSIKDGSKKRQITSSVNSRSTTPEPPSRKKGKFVEITDEGELLEEIPDKISRKSRRTISQEVPLFDSPNKQKIPSGTHEIHTLRDSSSTVLKSKPRNHSLHRSKSVEKESTKSNANIRRLSTNSTTHSLFCEKSGRNTARSSCSSSTILTNSSNTNKSINPEFDPHLIIKDEPIGDEEVVQRDQVTINDIPNLVSEGSSKRKTILISTSDNSNDSFPSNSRARKSFPNALAISHRLTDATQNTQMRNTSAMVCIPQVFPKTSTEERVNQELPQTSHQPQIENRPCENLNDSTSIVISHCIQNEENVTPLRSSISSQNDLPRLVPKPSGVFTSEGNTFQEESGAVASLFSENAHRMTDYFKSLLIDTINAISSGVSEAQNVLLKLELEKMKQQLTIVKNENQIKIEKLKKEHLDEIAVLRISYEEKIKNIQHNNEEDRKKLIAEIRQQCEIDKQRAIEATKREVKRITWCSNCNKEARFYCCWNTSYCGPNCQKAHWQLHQKYCTNRNTTENSNSSNNSRQNISDAASTSVTSPSTNTHYIPVTNSLPSSNSRQYIRSIPKQNSLQISNHTSLPMVSTLSSLSTPILNDTLHTIRSPKNHTIIQTGQKAIIQTFAQPTYVFQQHKIPPAVPTTALKAISSTLAAEQSLTSNLSNNLVVTTIARNNSPPVTVISTNKTDRNDIIAVSSSNSIDITSINNNTTANKLNTSQTITANNGSINSQLAQAKT